VLETKYDIWRNHELAHWHIFETDYNIESQEPPFLNIAIVRV